MKKPFRITGYHVLTGMVLFFAIIIAVNMVFISYAVKTFPGEQEKKSYLQGLNYNDRLKSRELQAAKGWVVNIEKAGRIGPGTHAIVELSFKDKSQNPINGLEIIAELSRPVDNDDDQALNFAALGNGHYQANIENAAAGVWLLRAHAIRMGGVDTENETFELETKLYFE